MSAPDIRHLPSDRKLKWLLLSFQCRQIQRPGTLLTNRARRAISKTPGRTQLINLFEVVGKRLMTCRAMAMRKSRKRDAQVATRAGEYLEKRRLQGLAVLMDIRHPLKDLDQQMIQWAVESNSPCSGSADQSGTNWLAVARGAVEYGT